ncbi:Hypothetical predicted protein [Cloeon dipterum]|uniref:Uncharacterized protein n=1 Tax=Cloeon dipterum TaxID=197152 RepID=A0A8S1C0U6_9INSE|nr:Hypothetical predicted protein [Cloeon dipterum]
MAAALRVMLLLCLALALVLAQNQVAEDDLALHTRVESVKQQVDLIRNLPKQQASGFLAAVDQLLAIPPGRISIADSPLLQAVLAYVGFTE